MKYNNSQAFKISFNLHYNQKLPEMDDAWYDFNGTFQNFELQPDDILALIQRGYPYTAHHHTYRQRDNFVCGQHLSLDFDTDDHNSTFLGIVRDPFIQQYAYALYTTPSHTIATPRARVLFLLDRPIYDKDRYQLLAEGLVHKYEMADSKCKDVCRFFWGSGEGGDTMVIGNVLPVSIAYLKIGQPEMEYRRRTAPNSNPDAAIIPPQQANGTLTKLRQNLINEILQCPDGEKHATLCRVSYTAGGYVAGGYFNEYEIESDIVQAISTRPSVRSLEAARKTIRKTLENGKSSPLYLEEREHRPRTLKDAGIF